MAVLFAEQEVKSKLLQKRNLSAFINAQTMEFVGKKCNLQYVFVSDQTLLQMNQQFLQHNTFTDIITFCIAETDTQIDGEIYISVDRVADNAIKFKQDYAVELHRVIFHGALHLCGFKDKTKTQKTQMRDAEDQWLQAYQIALQAGK
jgi:probable rRNA maturation factor